MERRTGWVAVAMLIAAASIAFSQRPLVAQARGRYGYYYHGKLVSLEASPRLIALQRRDDATGAFVSEAGLSLDGLSKETNFQQHGLTIYRIPNGNGAQLQSEAVISAARRRKLPVQPVFEAGMAVTIPSNQVIVGFARDTTLTAAQRFLAGYANRFGITSVRAHRPDTFLATISAPADGRAFGVSRALSMVPGIAFAEPNLVFTMLRDAGEPVHVLPMPAVGNLKHVGTVGGAAGSAPQARADDVATSPNWQTLLSEGFEGALDGWHPWFAEGTPFVEPFVVTAKKHSGTKSLYLTGGGASGVAPPGPYPPNCFEGIDSPLVFMAAYEEVYVDFWFYAKYGYVGTPIGDYALVAVVDPNTDKGVSLSTLAVDYTGDLASDPTSKSGWMHVLARVPPAWRRDGVVIRAKFTSDAANAAEGVYIDDLRVVGTTDVDTQPLGNDTYGAREYELQNTGQIAGYGNDSNDLNAPEAWAIQSVSPDVVVAVIDEGVDLSHPDLNLVTGYNSDGTVGGGPPTPADNHGTACAGNVGAKRNNNIGTIGTAPGVRIMPVQWGTTIADLAKSIDVAVANGAKVLSNSWGFADHSVFQDIEQAIDKALATNRIVVFAAGNGPDRSPWTYSVFWPGTLTATKDIITVGASSPTDEHKASASSDGYFYWGSSYLGDGPDVCAPGPWSYTTDRQGALGYNTDSNVSGINADYTHDFGGTSSSTPKVAGIIALMCSKKLDLTPLEAKTILRNTAKDMDVAGVDDKTGAGRVDALKAVQAVPGPPATITLTAPNGGENWQKGTVHNITWTSSNFTGNVKIELRINEGAYLTLFPNAPNTGSQSWSVDGALSANCRVRVSQATNPAVNDVSDTPFTIAPAANPTATPTGLDAVATSETTVDVSWTDNAEGEDGYKLERKIGNGAFQELSSALPPNAEVAHITDAQPGTTYSFRIRCFKGAANSAYSNTDTITTPGIALSAPTNLTAKGIAKNKVKLTWQDNSKGEDGFVVDIDYHDDRGFVPIDGQTSPNATGATISHLKKNHTYSFRVRAKKGDTYSAFSNTATAKTKKK